MSSLAYLAYISFRWEEYSYNKIKNLTSIDYFILENNIILILNLKFNSFINLIFFKIALFSILIPLISNYVTHWHFFSVKNSYGKHLSLIKLLLKNSDWSLSTFNNVFCLFLYVTFDTADFVHSLSVLFTYDGPISFLFFNSSHYWHSRLISFNQYQ